MRRFPGLARVGVRQVRIAWDGRSVPSGNHNSRGWEKRRANKRSRRISKLLIQEWIGE